MKLKNEIIEQRSFIRHEHEHAGERMTIDQLRKDKEMMLVDEVNANAIMDDIKEENSELMEVNDKLRIRI